MATIFDRSPLSRLADDLEKDRPKLPEIAPRTPADRPETTIPNLTGGAPSADSRNPSGPSRGAAGDGPIAPPADMVPLFVEAARKHRIPVNILAGLASQESGFNPLAIGEPTKWGRAKGLMQYLDSTAEGMGINPFDPVQSIDAAARQLRERLDKGYSMEDAVKEHFAGPDRRQWGAKTAQYGIDVLARARRVDRNAFMPPSFANVEGGARSSEDERPAYDPNDPNDPFSDAAMRRQAQANEDRSYWDRLGEAVGTGTDNMTRSLRNAQWAFAGGDSSEVARDIAESMAQQQRRQATRTTGQRRLDASLKEVSDADGFWGTAGAAARAAGTAITEPGAVGLGIAENAPNMAPMLGGAAAGAGTGAAAGAGIGAGIGLLGAGVGAAPGAAAGAGIGATWGARGGAVAGSAVGELGMEMEQMVQERLEAQNLPPTAENIRTILDSEGFRDDVKIRGGAKGLTIGLIDALTMKLGGRIAHGPIREAEEAVMRRFMSEGMTEQAARAALTTEAGKAAMKEATAGVGRRAAAAAGGAGVELVGEPVGEAASQAVARQGNVDWGDVTAEGIYGAGQSVAQTAAGYGLEAGQAGARRAAAAVAERSQARERGDGIAIDPQANEELRQQQEQEAAARAGGQPPPAAASAPGPDAASPSGQGVPVMITRAMREQLVQRGLTPAQIGKLTPQQAWDIINGATPPPAKPAGPLSDALGRVAAAEAAAATAPGARAVLEIPGEGVNTEGTIVQQDATGTLFRTDDGREFMVPAGDPEATIKPVSEASLVAAEPATDTMAQIDAIRDPSSGKDAALITPNSQVPDGALDGLTTIETSQGLFVTSNPEKAAAVEAAGGQLTTDDVGALLGYTTPKDQTDGTVVQATDAAGNVVHEEATNAGNLEAAAARAEEMAPDGGAVQVTDAVQALTRRQQGVDAEPEQQAPAKNAPQRELADYTEQELRDRLRYLHRQAKQGGWNKRLTEERRQVSAEIDRRAGAAQERTDDAVGSKPAAGDERRGGAEAAAPAGAGEPAGGSADAGGAAGGRSGAEGAASAVPAAVDRAGAADQSPAALKKQVFTGRTKADGKKGASIGSLADGTRRQLMVDPDGGYFWGDYKEASDVRNGGDLGSLVVEGEHAGFKPATFDSDAEARAAAESTPQSKTHPSGGGNGRAPHQMTRSEFEEEAAFQGVNSATDEAKPSYWFTDDAEEARQFAEAERGDGAPARTEPRIDIALKSDLDADWRDSERPSGSKHAYTGGPEKKRPVVASIPLSAASDPHRYLVEQAIARGEAVPDEVLADYPDLKAGASGKSDPHAGKWFGSREKADAYLAKKKAGGTHEVAQTGKARFEIKPKAAAEVGADIAAQAGMTAKAPSAKLRGDYSFLDKPQDPVAEAAAQAATSPENDRPEPTDAQKEAGKASRAPSGSVSRAPAPKADQAKRKKVLADLVKAMPGSSRPVAGTPWFFVPGGKWTDGERTISAEELADAIVAKRDPADVDAIEGEFTTVEPARKALPAPEKGAASPNATAPEHVAPKQQGVTVEELREMAAEWRSFIDGGGDSEVTNIFKAPTPSEIVRLDKKAGITSTVEDGTRIYHREAGWMTKAEAKAQIDEWKKHARAQARDPETRHDNSQKIVLSLFDLSGEWSRPWEEAGYQVYRFDIQDESTYEDLKTGEERKVGDVHNMSVEFFNDLFGDFDGNDVYAILAACPCTDFAVSGARHFAAKDADGRTVASVELVKKTLAAIEYYKPSVWAIENPVGRIESLTGLPPWRLSFDPFVLGDNYSKKTLIWGRFNADLPIAPVSPNVKDGGQGSKMHSQFGGKSMATKNARSETPEGFSYGFFMANNAADHPAMALSHKYDRLDPALIERAIEVGVTPEQIDDAVMDPYYQDLDDAAAEAAIQELIDEASPPPAKKVPAKAKEDQTPPAGNEGQSAQPTNPVEAAMQARGMTKTGPLRWVTKGGKHAGNGWRELVMDSDTAFVIYSGDLPTERHGSLESALRSLDGEADPAPAKPVAEPTARATPLNDDFGNYSIPTGAQLVSQSGRALAPAPKWDAETPRKRTLSLNRQRAWLVDEAIKESEAGGMAQGFQTGMLRRIDPNNFSRSDFDTVNDVLFGDPDGPQPEHFRAAAPAKSKAAPARKTVTVAKAGPGATAIVLDPSAGPIGLAEVGKAIAGAAYGANNTLVSRERAAELRERLKKKLAGQLNAGIDPEVLAIGAELAAFHIEAGARKFADFARAIAQDLGTTTQALRPYLRAWYNSARDLTEDAGLDVSDMNTPDEVRAELAALVANDQGDTNEHPQPLRSESGSDAAGRDQAGAEDGAGGARAAGPRGAEAQRPAGDLFEQADRDGGGDDQRGLGPDSRADAGDDRPAADRADGQPDGGAGERDGAGAGDRGDRRVERRSAGRDARRGAEPVRADGPVSAPRDYRIQPGELAREGSWKATAERNVEIVELVKKLEADGRPATDAERALMTRFTGWGASEIANGVFPDRNGRYKDGWQDLGERLKAALTPEEYDTARRSTQYAHYTSEGVIRSIYGALERMGFGGGSVLEPGMGVGLFKGLMPDAMASNSQYTGVEYDKLTGAIARHLYPASNVVVDDFTKTRLPKDFFDAAIGNPPFSQTRITNDPEYKKHGFLLHDYFFAKTMDRVKPGGLVVFVTSKGTMDKANDRARKYLADRADLVGAVRLPQTAFKGNAGTEVVTDVLFLRKRLPGEERAGADWLGLADVQTPQGPAQVNEYFAAHPEMVLGNHAKTGSMYRADSYTVEPRPGEDIEQAFARAVQDLPQGIYRPDANARASVAAARERDFNPSHQKEGGLYLAEGDGALMRVEQGVGVPVTSRVGSNGQPIQLTPKNIQWLKDWVGLRDALKTAHRDQLNDGDWETSLAALNQAYEAFVKRHGQILAHSRIEREDAEGETTVTLRFKNAPLYRMDTEGVLASALETVNEDGTIEKGAVLRGRVLKKPAEPVIETVQDAMMVQLNRDGRLNLDQVAKLAGTDQADVIAQLGSAIYEAPDGGWQTADEYLSGNVVRKLDEARAAAKQNRRYQRNVDALLAVQPRPLAPSEITVRLGANWVPAKDIEAFAKEALGNRVDVSYNDRLGGWTVAAVENTPSEFSTARMTATDLLDALLNNRQITVRDVVSDGKGGKTSVVNPQETEAANDRARKIKEAFGRWLWSDADRADRLTTYYNQHFNNIVPRQFDGSHLTLPGVSLRFDLRPHQKRAIWRNIQQGDTYYAHAVGAGKTFTAIASGMEQRRLGLIDKPVYVVPNHMLNQFSREFLELYPTANIMVADEHNFHTQNRRQFIAQAALNDPDAIILTHSSFGRVGMSKEFQQDYIERQIEEWKAALEEVDNADRITKKGIEQRIEQLERRLEAKAAESTKDQVMTFEDLGADYLFVDEAHEFRKLDFATNQARIKGIDPQGSQRAFDLHMKAEYLRGKRPGRALTMMSGTPVTNTMGELYTVQRFFQPEQLEEDGLASFDAWASQYGDIVTGLEQNAAGGYQQVSRFAKFQNVPELMHRVRSFMDILTGDQLGELVQRPDVKGGQREIVVTPAEDGYRAYQKTLEARIKAIADRRGPPKPGDDIILSVIGDGRFSAIDMRFVDPERAPSGDSKLDRMLDQLIADYHESADWEYTTDSRVDENKGAALMVFTDIGLGEQSAASRGFDMKAWIEKRLTDAGIPRAHIAFMRDHKAHAKKEKLFADVREGKKRILIGGKDMETGVNVQKRLAFLYHLDAPWFPASVEQREGRIVRQGNQNRQVAIRAYATKGSYDSTMWGMNARKQRFIDQAMSGNDSVRSMEDVSESSAFEMAAALASGDERYLKLAGLRGDAERLTRLANAHHDEQRKLRREREAAQDFLRTADGRRAALEEAIKRRQTIAAGEFAARVGKAEFDNRDEFSGALYDAFKELTATAHDGQKKLGTIGGFDILYNGHLGRGGTYSSDVSLDLPGDPSPLIEYPLPSGFAVNGVAARAANQVNGLDKALADLAERRASTERRLATLESRIGAPFPEQGELLEKQAELAELETELAKEQAAQEVAAAATPAEEPVGPGLDPAVRDLTRNDAGRAESVATRALVGKAIADGDLAAMLRGIAQQEGVDADQAVLARRLAEIVPGLSIKMVPAPADATAAGLYSNLTGEVWIHQALPSIVLHEVLHGITSALLTSPAARKGSGAVARAVTELNDLLGAAQAAVAEMDMEAAPAALRTLLMDPRGPLSNTKELLTYGLTDSAFQKWLDTVPAPAGRDKARTAWDWFKDALSTLLGTLRGRQRSALDALIETSGDLLDFAGANPGATELVRGLEANRQGAGADRAAPVDEPHNADAPADGTLDVASVKLDNRPLKDAVGGALTTLKKAGFLPMTPLNYLPDYATGELKAAVQRYLDTKRGMDTYRGDKHGRYDAHAQDWLAWAAKNPKENEALGQLMHDSTIAQIDPSKPPYNDGEPSQAYIELRARYDALPAEARKLYRSTRDMYLAQAAELDAIIEANVEKQMDLAKERADAAYREELARIRDEGLEGDERAAAEGQAKVAHANATAGHRFRKGARILRLRQMLESNRLAGPYFPLARFGDYTVTIRGKDGAVQSFSRFESPGDARWFAKQARSAWPSLLVEEGVLSEKDGPRGSVGSEFMAEVEELLGGAGAPDSLRDEVWQRYLMTMPDFSMRKRFIHRKGTPGFHRDPIRAFGSAMFHGAHQMARLKFGPDLAADLRGIQREAIAAEDAVDAGLLANEMKRRHDWVLDPKGAAWSQAISSGAFIWNLSVSPAAAIVNLTQTYMLGAPILGARLGGVARAGLELSRASLQLFSSKNLRLDKRLKGDEAAAMERFYALGLVDRTQAHDLAGVGETGVEYSVTRQKWMGRMSFLFHHAERINREVTALAAYRMARRQGQGHEAAVKTASELTWLTHFDYSNSSRARYAQSDVAKVVLIHKQHSINMTYRLFRDLRDALKGETPEVRRIARAQFAGVMGMHALMAGAKGLPFYGVAMIATGLLKDAFGDDDDERRPEDIVKKWLYDSGMPRELADVILYGAPSVGTGLSLYNRVGFPDFFFRSPDKELEGKAEAEYWIQQVLGAGLAIPAQIWGGVNTVREGNVQRGVEQMMPKFVRDVLKAGRYAKEGALTFTGDPIVDEMNAWELMGQAAGFTPFELSRAYDENNAKVRLQVAIQNRRARLMNHYALAWRNEDEEGMDAIELEFERFNEAYPEKPITAQGVRDSIRARERRSARSVGGVVLDQKLEDRVNEELGLPER